MIESETRNKTTINGINDRFVGAKFWGAADFVNRLFAKCSGK